MPRIQTTIVYGVCCLALMLTASVRAAAANSDPLGQLLQQQTGIESSIDSQAKADSKIEEITEAELILTVDPRWSRLFKTKKPVTRLAITNPEVVDVVQISPRQFEVVGRKLGETTMTVWFNDVSLRYLVRVALPEPKDEK